MSRRERLLGAVRAFRDALLHDQAPPPQAPPQRWGPRRNATDGHVRGLTPARIASLIRQADDGDPRGQAQLLHEMEDRDTHLVSVLGVRKRAAANLPILVDAASDDLIDRAVQHFVRTSLSGIEGWTQGLVDLLDAVSKGYSAAEIDWAVRDGVIAPRRLMHRPAHWLRPDQDAPDEWRVMTDREPTTGERLWPQRWIVHVSRAKSGSPSQAGLGRTLAWWYLYKSYAIKDWATYAEKYGSPLRLGKYPEGADDADIRALEEAIEQLGVDAYAVMPAAMTAEFVSDAGARTGADVYERLATFSNREISKAVLGQTLTTEESARGTQGLGSVHNDVRGDLRDSDAGELADTLRRDLVTPLVRLNWGEHARIPGIRFAIDPPADVEAEVRVQSARASVLRAARDLGLAVTEAQVRDELGVREARDGERVIAQGEAP